MRILSILSTLTLLGVGIGFSQKASAQSLDNSLSTVSSLDDATNFVFEPQLIPNVQVDRFQWGFDSGVRWDDNLLLAAPGQEEEAFTYNFSPDFLFTVLGDHYTAHMVTLGYGVDFLFGDDINDVDINQDADLFYRFQSDRTRVALRGRYSRIGGVTGTDFARFGDSLSIREIGRAEVDRYGITADIDYRISNYLSLDVRYGYNEDNYSRSSIDLNNRSSHGGQIGLNYGTDRLHFGPYVGFERTESEDNPSQDAYQVGGAVNWEYSELTSFFGQFGYDERSFDGVGADDDRSSFVWSTGVDWHPSEIFSGRLSVSRSILPSAIEDNQNFQQSAVNLALRRQFLGHYYGRVITSYSWIDYDANIVDGSVTPLGSENYFTGYAEIGRDLADWGHASIYYSLLDNDSDLADRSYDNNTVGFRFGVDF